MHHVFQLVLAITFSLTASAESLTPTSSADPFASLVIQEQQTTSAASTANLNALITSARAQTKGLVSEETIAALVTQCNSVCQRLPANSSCVQQCVGPGIHMIAAENYQQVQQVKAQLEHQNQALQMLAAQAPDKSSPLLQAIAAQINENNDQLNQLKKLTGL